MDINTLTENAVVAAKEIGKAGRLAKQHGENRKSATQTVFECIKTALNDYQVAPKQFRIEVFLQAGHPITVYDIDGEKSIHNADGEKPHGTLKTVFSRCATYHKLNGNLDVEAYNDVLNALKDIDEVGEVVKKRKKADKAYNDLSENQQHEFWVRMQESDKQAA